MTCMPSLQSCQTGNTHLPNSRRRARTICCGILQEKLLQMEGFGMRMSAGRNSGSLRPQLLNRIILPSFCREDVHDHVDVVENNPLRPPVSGFTVAMQSPVLLQNYLYLFGQGFQVGCTRACCQEYIVRYLEKCPVRPVGQCSRAFLSSSAERASWAVSSASVVLSAPYRPCSAM